MYQFLSPVEGLIENWMHIVNLKQFVESWQLVLVTMSARDESQLTPGNISSFQRTS